MNAFTVIVLATPVLPLLLGWFTTIPEYGPGHHPCRRGANRHFDHPRYSKLNLIVALILMVIGTLEGLEMWLNHIVWYAPTVEEAAAFTQPGFIATASDPKTAWIIAILGALTYGGFFMTLYVIAIEARHKFNSWHRTYLLKRENDRFWKRMRKGAKISGIRKGVYTFRH